MGTKYAAVRFWGAIATITGIALVVFKVYAGFFIMAAGVYLYAEFALREFIESKKEAP